MKDKDHYLLEQLYLESQLKRLIEETEKNENCVVKQVFKLSPPNAKFAISKQWSFSLNAGETCPFAKSCLAKAVIDPTTGKMTIERGKDAEFTCFAARDEALYPDTFKQRDYNTQLVRKLLSTEGIQGFVDTMKATFEVRENKRGIFKSKVFRIHVGGDFESQQYFDAWCEFVKHYPELIFYAYTKSALYALKHDLPSNFRITHSIGSYYDKKIVDGGHKFAAVIYKPEDVEKIGPGTKVLKGWRYTYDDGTQSRPFDLPIDHDDSNAYLHNDPFALLIHGTQEAGSVAAKALNDFKKKGVVTSYSKKKKEEDK
jgi:hypothetical protein